MTRKNRDLDRTAARFLNALRRVRAGIEQQRQRILAASANAPRLLPGTAEESILIEGEGNDLDYYLFELARLRGMGGSISTIWGDPPELESALRAFDLAIPRLREIRNPLTHINDTQDLDSVYWFSSLVRLNAVPPGRGQPTVEILLDPRYEHHVSALAYADALIAFLRTQVKQSIAADAPAPLDQQIAARRNASDAS